MVDVLAKGALWVGAGRKEGEGEGDAVSLTYAIRMQIGTLTQEQRDELIDVWRRMEARMTSLFSCDRRG
jgi:hypothetical protein